MKYFEWHYAIVAILLRLTISLRLASSLTVAFLSVTYESLVWQPHPSHSVITSLPHIVKYPPPPADSAVPYTIFISAQSGRPHASLTYGFTIWKDVQRFYHKCHKTCCHCWHGNIGYLWTFLTAAEQLNVIKYKYNIYPWLLLVLFMHFLFL